MALHSNLQRRKTSYYFRQAVPSHLITVFGKSEIVRSLGTCDPTIAKERCRQVALEVSGWFDNKLSSEDNTALDKFLHHNQYVKSMPEPVASIQTQPTMDDLLERWAMEQNLRTDAQRQQSSYYTEIKRVVKRCNDKLGSIPISQINDDSIRLVKESYFEDQANGSIKKFKTIKKYVDSIKMLIDFAVANAWLPANHIADGAYNVRTDDDQKADRHFKPDALKKLFHSPYFTGYHLPTKKHVKGDRITKDHFYWMPLIALCTGMRIEEIAQLSVDDILEEEGIAYINVTDAKSYQKLKNEPSKRKIPIHYELLNCGFMKYVNSIRDGEHDRLFPKLTMSREGKLSKNYSRDFGRYIKRIEIEDEGVVFHSFRHRFADALKNSTTDIKDSVRLRLEGHAAPNMVAEGYGKGFKVSKLKKAIDSISLDVDLSHLFDCDGEPIKPPEPEVNKESVNPTVITPPEPKPTIPLKKAYEQYAVTRYGEKLEWDEVKLLAHDNRSVPRDRRLLNDIFRDDLMLNHPLFENGDPARCVIEDASDVACRQAEELRHNLLKALYRLPYQLVDKHGKLVEQKISWIDSSPNTKIFFMDSSIDCRNEDGSVDSYRVMVEADAFAKWLEGVNRHNA